MGARTRDEWHERLLAERRKARRAVRDFVEGAASGNTDRMSGAFEVLDHGEHGGGGWRRAFRAVSSRPAVPDATRSYFLQVFLKCGDHIRQETGDDLVYASGLRVLLPPYKGRAPLRLYRGEGALNRKRRTYGLSWTNTREVARRFAEIGNYRCSVGGSVLLTTLAPRAAIICAPALLTDSYSEDEYIVDRRFLSNVNVEERFAHLTTEEFDALRARSSGRS